MSPDSSTWKGNQCRKVRRLEPLTNNQNSISCYTHTHTHTRPTMRCTVNAARSHSDLHVPPLRPPGLLTGDPVVGPRANVLCDSAPTTCLSLSGPVSYLAARFKNHPEG